MARILGYCIVWLVGAVGFAHAVPARPLYEPPEPTKAVVVSGASLFGSAWLAPLGKVNRVFIFEGDGTLSYKTSAAAPNVLKNRGTWRVEGDTVHFAYGLKAGAPTFEFRGVLQGNDVLVGEYTTKAGAKTPMTLQRMTADMK